MAGLSGAEWGVGAVVGATLVVYASTDSDVVSAAIYVGALAVASVLAWLGVWRMAPGRRLVGGLIASGLSLSAVGDLLWEVLDRSGRATDVSIADAPWFASYVLLGVAMWVVLRRSGPSGRDDLTFAVDAVTVVVVSILIFWSAAIDAIVADESLAPLVRVVWASYPVADAILMALVVRVLMSRTARTALDTSFAVGVLLWLAADIAFLRSPHGFPELAMDSAWMVAPFLLARSTWRSAPTPTVTAGVGSPRSRLAQLTIAIGPLLVPPGLEVVADLRGKADAPLLMVVGTLSLTLLAFVRTALLLGSERRAHDELAVARDAALEGSRVKSMFVANMSHEIRTPLTTVLGVGEILEDTELDELQLDLVRRMRRSGALLCGLVDDILDFSRIEAGHLELTSDRFDLHALVDDLAQSYGSRAVRTDIRFDVTLKPGVPRTVVGDPARLLQVLDNLLDNAFKFTPEGSVRLEVRPAPDLGDRTGPEEAVVEFVATDTGIGIAGADLASVFESFNQVDGSTTRRYGGSGLGLAIGRELAEAMGGSLTATSEPGVGSAFMASICLGRAVGESDHPGPAEPPRAGDRDHVHAVPALG